METTPNTSATRDLTSTLKVDEIVYNINAVNALNSDKVNSSLTVKPVAPLSSVEGEQKEITFDGSSQKAFEAMTAAGGAFIGGVQVPSVETGNMSDGVIKPEAVLNYADIENIVLADLKNNSTAYSYEHPNLIPLNKSSLTPEENINKINGISIILGKESEFLEHFVYSNTNISSYLYICNTEDDLENSIGNIYFGLCSGTSDEEDTYIKLATNADRIINNTNSPEFYDGKKLTEEFTSLNTNHQMLYDLTCSEEKSDSLKSIIKNFKETTEKNILDLNTALDDHEINAGKAIEDLEAAVAELETNSSYTFYISGNSTDKENTITVSKTEPANPNQNDIWIKIT